MNPKKYSIDEVLCATGNGDAKMYEIIDKDGTVYATTYDKYVAELIANVLNSKM